MRGIATSGLMAALGLTAAACIAAPTLAELPYPVTAKLQPWRTRWAMSATVAGKPHLYLLDTGAGVTLLSAKSLAEAGCTPWGRITGYTMMGQRGDGPRCEGVALQAGPLTLMPPIVGPVDMASLNPKDADLDGIIGLNAFEDQLVTIDFAAGLLTVETSASLAARVARMIPLKIRLKREVDGLALAVAAAVSTSKGTLWMELDSGNGGTILVSKPVADLVGMDPARDGKQPARFKVTDDVIAETGDGFAPDMIMDGNLGMPFLRNWVLTLDLQNGRAWLGKPPVPPKPAVALTP